MQKIKLALKVFNSKSEVEKILVRLENQSIHDVSEEKQLNPLISCLKNAELTEDGGATISHLFNCYVRNCKTWQSAFKFLYVSHALMNAVGNRFCHSFLTEHFENILDLMKTKNVEDYVHSVLAANYYNFLILYAKYLPDLRKHEMKGPERFLKSLQEGDYTELVQIVTFKNIIKYFTKVEECIEGSANVLPQNKLINKISVLLFKDVVVIYNLIRKNLQVSMDKIFEIDAGLALLLDQLYSDTIQITNKLQSLVSKLSYDKANQIPKIHYFTFNLDFNKQEELFILELRKSRAQQGIEDKNESYYGYMQQYQTLNPGRKLFKLNTKVSQLTKISESEAPRTNKNYFNLQSPEPSQFEEAEDDSYSPMKLNEIMNGGGGGDDDDDDDSKNNILGMVDNEVAGRDVTRTLQMELVSPKSKLFPVEDQGKTGFRIRLDNQEYQPRVGAESVIFTPTAVHHYPNQPGEQFLADSPNLYINKKQSNHNFFDDDYDFAQTSNKKRFNLNPSNF